MAVIERRPSTREPSPQWGSPPEPPRRRRFTGIVVVLVAVAVAVVGGGILLVNRPAHKAAPVTTNTQSPTPAGTAPAASTPNRTTAEQATMAAVLADYRTAQGVLIATAHSYPVNPTDPRLADHMTGPELRTVQNGLSVLRLQNRYGVGTEDLGTPMVTAINSTSATITDCIFDHTSFVNGATGQTVSPADTKTTLNTITMVLEGGTWKMSDNQRVGTGCAQSA